MGIGGLLPFLKPIHNDRLLKEFEGKTIGVDAYGWMHRGAHTCAKELATGQPTKKWLHFCMKRVAMLQAHKITPFLVFDGDNLPSKRGTEKDRAEKRRENKQKGEASLNAGKEAQAIEHFKKAINVTPEMARELIEELKRKNLPYIVAPYEADPQLVYLEKNKIIDGILSEDSDMLVFGAQCLLTKLNDRAECVEINAARFSMCRNPNLFGWKLEDLRAIAIFSGCDYLTGIKGVGLKKAYDYFGKHKSVDRAIKAMRFQKGFTVPPDYLDSFKQAENTFRYQWVYCPESQGLRHLNEPEAGVDPREFPYIGEYVEPEVAQQVASGDLHPSTKRPIVPPHSGRHRAKTNSPRRSIGHKIQTPASTSKAGPLNAFFKSSRTPLGERNPNDFTPSPSQRKLLERNKDRSWDPVTAPLQPSLSKTSPTVPGRSPSESPPQRSRFFEGTPKKRKASGTEDVTVWSDESFQETPSLSDAGQPRLFSSKKLRVFSESQTSTSRSGTPISLVSHSSTHSLTATPTPDTSFCSSADSEVPPGIRVFRDMSSFRYGNHRSATEASTSSSEPESPQLPEAEDDCPDLTEEEWILAENQVLLSAQSSDLSDVEERGVRTAEAEVLVPASDADECDELGCSVVPQTPTFRGSEDAIIHESDQENTPPKARFGQFMYAGI